MAIALDVDFPAIYARTDRFRRGMPRTFEVTDDHVTFLRSLDAYDATLSLWRFDLGAGVERCLVSAADLHADDADLPPAERARRERLRESGAGITGYSMSATGDRIAFAVGGGLWLWDAFGLRSVDTPGAVFDPRIDRAGDLVSCVIEGAVYVISFVDGEFVATISRPGRSVGMADFAAAEELSRYRGHWWSPTGDFLIVEVVDESPVPVWRIADPTFPDREPHEHRYPHAGADNAICSLLVVELTTGTEREVVWDRTAFEYLVSVSWSSDGAPLVTLANRQQTRFETFSLDPATASLASVLVAQGEPWAEVSIGAPAWLPGGRLLHIVEDLAADTRRLAIDGSPITEAGYQISGVVSAGANGVVVVGSADPRTLGARHIALDGSSTTLSAGFTYCQFASNGAVHVRVTLRADSSEKTVEVLRGDEVLGSIGINSERAVMPAPAFVTLGETELNAVILWPENPVEGPLPVVLAPYGGPHHLEVVAAAGSFAEDQWLANHGFCVIIADGRGTPGRGLAWEHAIADKFAEITLQDQVIALESAAAMFPGRIDASRVGIRGWSYGGYLSALALLARPDVFHVGIAGAPVTDWRLYDTAYTERYLGDPNKVPEIYEENSLLNLAPNLRGKLMIVHGLADDNVVSAHSLQLSGALLAAGKMHDFLPLAGVSHMTPQVAITENLMRIEANYFREHLKAK